MLISTIKDIFCSLANINYTNISKFIPTYISICQSIICLSRLMVKNLMTHHTK